MPRAATHSPARPRTRPTSGRARRALNSNSHGLRSLTPVIPGVESEEEWLIHLAGIVDDLHPVGQLETLIAERIAFGLWRLRRILRYETQLVTTADPDAIPQALRASNEDKEEDDAAEDDHEGDTSPAPTASTVDAPDDLHPTVRPENARAILACVDEVVFAADEKVIPSPIARTVIDLVRQRVCDDPLESFAVPGTADVPLAEFTGWTAGLVRLTIRAMCERVGKDPHVELYLAVDHCRTVSTGDLDADDESNDDDDPEDHPSRRGVGALSYRRSNTMPIDSPLKVMIEYERHISRQLHTDLHDLEVIQARRQKRRPTLGDTDLSPAALPTKRDSDKRNGHSQIESPVTTDKN